MKNKIIQWLKDIWATIKATFTGFKWVSKEQYYAFVEKVKNGADDLWNKADSDKDGWITTKEIKDLFKKRGE